MCNKRRIIIVDKSELAGNLYGILFAPLNARIIVKKRFQDAAPYFFRREKIDLGIFNSNIFGKKFEEIHKNIVNAEPLLITPKIFLTKDTPSDRQISEILKGIEKSEVMIRPFHPDGLYAIIERLLK
jgi:hypothetical protein